MGTEYSGTITESIPLLEETLRENFSGDFMSLGSLGSSGYDSTRAFLRSVFRARGLTICVSEVTVTTQGKLGRCFPQIWPPKIHCDSAVAFMREGGLHLIADVDGVAGMQLLRVLTGVCPCVSGSILANGVPVEAGAFRRFVGVISAVETSMPNFTVEDNINFVIFMSTRVNQESRGELVQAACIITELDRLKKVKSLSLSERFRLCLAMELVRDPPILVAYYPLDNLSHMEVAECCATLKRVSSILEKTVVISCRSFSANLFGIANTVLLFGRGGCVLYSGEAAAMPSYFNRLPCYGGGALKSSHGSEDTTCSISTGARWRKLSGSSKETTPHDIGQRSFSRFSSGPSPRALANEDLGLTGDDALDVANLWAENQATTNFYSKFYDSFGRRKLLQSMEHHSVPPQDCEDIRPFKNTTTSQHAVLKPFFLLWYDVLHVWRDPGAYVHLGSLALGLLVILLLVQYQSDDQGGMYNKRGILFVLFLMTIMSNVEAMDEISSYLRFYLHQRESGLYNTCCFLVVFVFRAIIIRSVCLALFVPVVIYGAKMKASLLLLIGSVSLTHALLHLAVHALVPLRSWAQLVLYIYAGYCVIFSGFLINLKSLPSFVGTLSVLRWGYGAALSQNLRDMPFRCDGVRSTSYCYTGNAYLDIEGFLEDSTSFSVTVLGVMCVVLLFLISTALAFRK